ncbi:MAG TPA: TonB-dependent receptor [Gemmatimonadaceae bacterium]|nr:TonB-dependent receptor [Gemmatimonadaceae bacterium]
MKLESILAAISCALLGVYSTPAISQTPDTTHLGTVVISASKVPKPADALTQAVTVISGDDLRARGVTRVTDALREVPGATLVQSGSYGALTSLFLRGGESRYTKVLIDGVPVNAPGGYFDFSHLTTDNIDRIEIVRGPASVLYGADAATGVVQIFTRRPDGARHASLGVRGGTYGSLDADGDLSASRGLNGLTLGAAHHSSDGVIPFNNQYKNGTLSSNVTLASGSAGDARVSARYTAAEFHFPTDFTGQPVDSNAYRTQHRLTVGLDAGRNFGQHAQGRLLAGTNDVSDITDDIAVTFGSPTPQHSRFTSRGYRRNVEGRAAFFLPAGTTVTFGGTYEKEHENSATGSGDVGAPTTQTDAFDASRHNVAYYTEILGNPLERLSYTLSGRVDDNSDYDRFATYRVGANVGVAPGLKARASISTAFNAPAFNQLRPTLFTVGNPNLRPEKIRSAEIGLTTSFRPDLIRISAGYFNQRFSDLIQYVSGPPPDFKGSFANLTAASSNGVETEIALYPVESWRATASYTIAEPRVTETDPSYEGSDRPGDALIRRPTHSGAVTISYGRGGGLNLGTAISYVGKRPDLDFAQFPSPRVTLPAYTKVDLSAEFPVTRQGPAGITLTGRIENLFDKRYEDVLNFEAPGRAILLGARATGMF